MTPTRLGKYEIVAKIGQGAMGEVYRAVDPLLGREVAIKTMSEAIGRDPELRRRFQREAQSAGRLNHPNIITVYDFGDDDGQAYIAMELLEGDDLKDLIARHVVFSLDEKLDLMEQMAEGLAFAHARGVIHRDLKPANIHVLPGGRVKIMDFGLARVASSDMTRTGLILGTPNYMSPEQVRGETATAQSDVFSLGAVFYELLTARRAFSGESVHSVLYQVVQQEPTAIRSLAGDVPVALSCVVERAMAKDGAGRFPNAAELREALRTARAAIGSARPIAEPPVATQATPSFGSSATRPAVPAPGSARGTIPTAGAVALSHDRRERAIEETVAGEPTAYPAPPAPPTPIPPPTELLAGLPARDPRRAAVALEPPARATGSRPESRRGLIAVTVVVAAVALGSGVYVVASRGRSKSTPTAQSAEAVSPSLAPAIPSPAASAALNVTSSATAALLEEGRGRLRDRDYRAAATLAEAVLARSPQDAGGLGLLRDARAGVNAGDRIARDLRAALAAGDLEEASSALTRLTAADPRHPELAALSQRVMAALTSEARKIQSASQRQATTSGRPPDTSPRPAPAVAPTTAPRQATAPDSVPSASPTPEPMREATPPSQPALAAIPMPPTPGQLEASKGAIRSTIESYRAAFEMRNADALRHVFPRVDYERYKETFAKVESYRARIEVQDISLDGDRGAARCVVTYTIKPSPAGKLPSQRQVFHVRRSGETWIIDSIEVVR